MPQFDAFLATYGLAGIFVLLLLKSIGVPLPIPSGAIMLATALGCAQGDFTLGSAFLTLLVASLIGSAAQFWLLRGPARGLTYRFGRRVGLTPERLDLVSARVYKSRWPGIALLLFTPGLRSITIVACGLSGVPFRRFALALVATTAPALALNLSSYFMGGALIQSLSIPSPLIITLLLICFVAALLILLAIRKRQILAVILSKYLNLTAAASL